jgi:hypothetical protein
MVGCTFCSAPSFAKPLDDVAICERCAARVGRLAKEDSGDIWAVVAVSRSTPPGAPDGTGASGEQAGGEQPSFTKMLRVFQRQVAERIATTDSESHYHLAHAYRAMGLFEDAVRAAGLSLDIEPPGIPHAPALTLLFTEPLLREGGLDRVKELLGVR